MHYSAIEKKATQTPANLADYEQSYRDFQWQSGKKELAYFSDGTLNIAHNVLDKHLGTETENKPAMIWTDGLVEQRFTFGDLIKTTNRFANVLKDLGVLKGDRVFMFLPRIPDLYSSFLGTLKIGAIAGNMFAAFGYEALKDRLQDSGAKVLITNKELFERVKEIKETLPELEHVLLVDDDLPELMNKASDQLEVAHMAESDPAYMLYTSGTTGKPKGVVHSHGDLVQQHLTTQWVLDLKKEDIYWCTADPGWVTGVVYGIIGPWSNGITQVVYNGRFDPDLWYGTIEKHHLTVWYTAPTAIRMLMTDEAFLKKHDLSSLRHIASVGEPLNPEAIVWAEKNLKLPIHDNYWQTETGSIVIANYPSMDIKPGSMGKPIPGIRAGIIDEKGIELPPGKEGDLALKPNFPSLMKTIWNNEEKFKGYFRDGWYITGDRASKDEYGYFWFVGRADDVIKTSGERVGPFEVESALLTHPAVAEAGVIGKPDPLRGEIIKAFIKLKNGNQPTEELKKEIQQYMKKELAGHAYPREIEFVEKLPKTRSGKIMRRVLKMKELGQDVGDISTMEEY